MHYTASWRSRYETPLVGLLSRRGRAGREADAGRRHPSDGRRAAAIARQSVAGCVLQPKYCERIMNKVWLKNYPPGVPAEINPNEYPLAHGGARRAAASASRSSPPSRSMGRTITYAEYDRLARDFAAWLQQSAKLQQGDRIAIMLPNVLQYPIALFGALRAGLTVVNTNPLYTARELEHQLNDSGAKAIVILENFAHTLAAGDRADRASSTSSSPASATSSAGRSRRSSTWSCATCASRCRAYELPGAIALQRRARAGPVPARSSRSTTDSRRHRVPAVHRRHDRRRQGRDAHSSQHGRERAAGGRVDRHRGAARPGHDHHGAAAVSHLRAHRRTGSCSSGSARTTCSSRIRAISRRS